ncbi:MAG: fused MFS/spermidine synthase [Deltaproteobacteria bacterium]|nr:fused MFS/spermidine synthase [Deltaproteobacteria bacterium]
MAAVILFSLTLAFSASLLFAVQPMIGKAILPALGGTPATWTVCLLFFQALLLAAYLYAHLLDNLRLSRQVAIHIIVICAAFLFPLSVLNFPAPGPGASPQLWLLSRLLWNAGCAYFVLAATAPLIQAWFSRTQHGRSSDPYFLYASSNAGSLAGLLAYPLIIEPLLELQAQESLWRSAFTFCAVLLTATGIYSVWRGAGNPIACSSEAGPPPPVSQKLLWCLLAFIPSSLLLGITTHITTNVSPVPLFWVVPLALYLITFIISFSSLQPLLITGLSRYFPIVLLGYAPLIYISGSSELLLIAMQLIFFFVVCLYCHCALVSKRPAAEYLTSFYLWMSFGGMLGGVFNALVAPNIFAGTPEYALMLAAAAVVWGCLYSQGRSSITLHVILICLAAVSGVAAAELFVERINPEYSLELFAVYGAPALIIFGLRRRPAVFSAMFCLLLIYLNYHHRAPGQTLVRARNFFGSKEVRYDSGNNTHKLIHGTIVHGIQSREPSLRSLPMSYYHPDGPLGDIFKVSKLDAWQVAVIGLGTGAMAAYARPQDSFKFFEIDPLVISLAEDERYFTFLAEAEGKVSVEEGDGRLLVAKERTGSFDIIILDPFTSGAIPAHLITLESISTYFEKLKPNGLVVFNVSNNFVSLDRLLLSTSRELNVVAITRMDLGVPKERAATGRYPSHYVVLTKNEEIAQKLRSDYGWHEIAEGAKLRPWRDHYSNIISIIR